MAKFNGEIGYAIQEETAPGVWIDQITKKNYRGDVISYSQRWEKSENVNDNFTIDNSISIIADEYAYANSGRIKYIIWQGQKWSIKSLSVNRPRIVLQIGGVYNGEE